MRIANHREIKLGAKGDNSGGQSPIEQTINVSLLSLEFEELYKPGVCAIGCRLLALPEMSLTARDDRSFLRTMASLSVG